MYNNCSNLKDGIIPKVHVGNVPNYEVGYVPNFEGGDVPNFEVGNVQNFEVGNVPNLKLGNCIQSIITQPGEDYMFSIPSYVCPYEIDTLVGYNIMSVEREY